MKNKAPIKPAGKKKIVKGPSVGNFRVPTEDEWTNIQEALGDEGMLSAELKDQIATVTMMFANASPAIKAVTTVKKVQKELYLWQSRTKIVRKNIWTVPTKGHPKKLAVEHIFQRYQKLARGIKIKPSLALLAEAIDAAVLTSEYVIQRITHTDFEGTRQHELWMIWVALVVSLLMENKIKVTRVTKRWQELKPEFIDFMEELQKVLPGDIQSRRTRPSLIKGLNETELRLGKVGFDTLFEMLMFWGTFSLPDYIPDKYSRVSHRFSWAIALAESKASSRELC